MKLLTKLLILGLITLVSIIIVVMFKPIPQDQSYHLFADHYAVFGIPNFANVITNIPFLFVGVYGLWLLKKSSAGKRVNVIYAIIFTGIFLTGLGSAYYHYSPNNDSLVFDRIPMTIVFMAFLSSIISGWINSKAGIILFVPLLLLGIGSVLCWHYTELNGTGDLRFYGFIQFYPMIIIPVIFLLFQSKENNKGLYLLVWVIVWYIVAKLCETFDKEIYSAGNIVSGHSLKHLAAAAATWYIIKFFEKKYVSLSSKLV